MKRISIFLILFLLWAPIPEGDAQETISVIESLLIDIWPDYDKPSVLVLLTGTLPDNTKLPVAVTIPIPQEAQLNAVARIDGKDGRMVDDIFFNLGPADTLKLVTPDLRFRVEYYFPYTADNNHRFFDYTWIANLTVNNLQLKVQQPLSAVSLNMSPESRNAVKGGDGFDYHTYPVKTAPAGQPLSIHVEYKMAAAQLSAERLPQQRAGRQPADASIKSLNNSGISWPVIAIAAGGLMITIALIWQLASRRSPSGDFRDRHPRPSKQSAGGFCRNCGEPVDKGDNYCRGCGQEL